ncbi:hypothetical protein NB706_003617 [Xanthomonas sacchari]|nr:hypothetical protein [Xanthomonas sacchari]
MPFCSSTTLPWKSFSVAGSSQASKKSSTLAGSSASSATTLRPAFSGDWKPISTTSPGAGFTATSAVVGRSVRRASNDRKPGSLSSTQSLIAKRRPLAPSPIGSAALQRWNSGCERRLPNTSRSLSACLSTSAAWIRVTRSAG